MIKIILYKFLIKIKKMITIKKIIFTNLINIIKNSNNKWITYLKIIIQKNRIKMKKLKNIKVLMMKTIFKFCSKLMKITKNLDNKKIIKI